MTSPRRAPSRSRLTVLRLEDRTAPSAASARAGLQFLGAMHDEYHTRLPVYDDVSSAGNHFVAIAKFPSDQAPVSLNGSWTGNPHSGATAIRNELSVVSGQPFGGLFFQNGLLSPDGTTVPNFGEVHGAGVRIPSPARLTFWARGEKGGEKVEFFAFGVGRDPVTGLPDRPGVMPDSSARTPATGTVTTLTTSWERYTIELAGKDTSYVLGGFGWAAAVDRNPSGAVFYLDDIQYELTEAGERARGSEPRFARSYRTGPAQRVPGPAGDFDFVLRNSAFSYDNALTALAFLADRDPGTRADSLRRARLIGDAFVYAAANDRTYTDGRIRSNYAAGNVSLFPGWAANGKLNTTPVAGFYDESQQPPRFLEVLQRNVDTGNNAWVMVALLALYRRTGEPAYLGAARRVGEFILSMRNDAGQYQGFLGGVNNAEHRTEPPTRRPYASTEHNIDIYAAFTRMFELTGEPVWRDGAGHAWRFVEAMWDPSKGAFLAGTKDPNTRNADAGQLPLDVQAWVILARPDVLATHPELLDSIDRHFRVTERGVVGYDFNEDRDGVWPEGTGQVATALAVAGRRDRSLYVRQQLDQIRQGSTAPGTDQFGLPAALHDGLSTGFQTEENLPFQYHNRLHIGATAWNVFAQLGFNPYYQTGPLPVLVGGPVNGAAQALAPSDGQFVPSEAVAPFRGTGANVRTAVADVTGDGVPDLISGTGPGTPTQVKVIDGMTLAEIATLNPFEAAFTGGVFVAAADIDGDGKAEVVVTPDEGGGPVVVVYRGAGLVARQGDGSQATRFFGIEDANFRGGARPAVGDVSGDGKADVVVSAGFLGGPRIALFDGAALLATPADQPPPKLVADFFAFEDSLRNGAFVAAGDATGDGVADLAFGGGPGGGPRVRVFDGAKLRAAGPFTNLDEIGTAQAANFFAGDDALRGGVRLALRDADGDGRTDLLTGSGDGEPSRVRVYLTQNLLANLSPGPDQELDPFGAVLPNGVFVG